MPLKSNKIKQTNEYQKLLQLKKLWSLFFCPTCNFMWHCCSACVESAGYLRFKVEGEDYPEPFLQEGIGCQLPLELKSVTCITFMCKEKRATIGEEYLRGLDALTDVMKGLEFDLYLMEIK